MNIVERPISGYGVGGGVGGNGGGASLSNIPLSMSRGSLSASISNLAQSGLVCSLPQDENNENHEFHEKFETIVKVKHSDL